jgi:hypothetical protein
LYCDNFGAHNSEEQKTRLSRRQLINERGLITNATGVMQPVDQHIGRQLQLHMKGAYYKFKEDFLNEADADDFMGRDAMRGHICEWADAAWKKVRADSTELIKRAWMNTGFFLTHDCSEDNNKDLLKF